MRTSSTISRRRSTWCRTCSRKRPRVASSISASSIRVSMKPRIADSGVLSSWDTFATKWRHVLETAQFGDVVQHEDRTRDAAVPVPSGAAWSGRHLLSRRAGEHHLPLARQPLLKRQREDLGGLVERQEVLFDPDSPTAAAGSRSRMMFGGGVHDPSLAVAGHDAFLHAREDGAELRAVPRDRVTCSCSGHAGRTPHPSRPTCRTSRPPRAARSPSANACAASTSERRGTAPLAAR